MKNLLTFIENKNAMKKLWGDPLWDVTNADDRQLIANRINCELSPEILHCDGEISHAQAMKKYRFLTACARELKKLDSTVEIYEL